MQHGLRPKVCLVEGTLTSWYLEVSEVGYHSHDKKGKLIILLS